MHELYEIKEQLMEELKEYRNKQKMNMDDITVIKYLTSSIDHLCNIIMAAEEEEGYSERGNYSREGMSRNRNRYSYEGGQGGSSYARGRNARRDSMGRYSREGNYSRNDGVDSLVEDLRSMIAEVPNGYDR